MIQHEYKHKPFICECNPNYEAGDEIFVDENGNKYVDWGNLPNHREPRNEWTLIGANILEHECLYCLKPMKPNPLAGQVELIKNGKRGSWQTNKPRKKNVKE